MAAHARYSLPPGYNHTNGHSANGAPVLPHIDDLVAIPSIDRNQPIRKLLDIAEAAIRQAEFSRDIKKLAPALQDFVKASVIAVQFIRQHKDYEFVKGRQEFAARHQALLKKINLQNDAFAEIKTLIIDDNKRTGVQPLNSRPSSSQGAADSPRSSIASDRGSSPSSSAHQRHGSLNGAVKSKPTIQPKPKSLLGNAIGGHARSGSTASATNNNSMQDLAARFANLRGPQASPGQDPRIKTHPITLPTTKPVGPREMPPKPKLALDSSVPTLPKMPDAIYSPARSGPPGENGKLPSTSSRGFARTPSAASGIGSPNLSRQSTSSDYFSSTQPYTNGSVLSRTNSRESSLDLPRGDVILPEGLVQIMKSRATLLLIDIRSREEFDEGHIMHSSIICIEPSVLEREGLSADQISQSLVLSPGQEQDLFEKRETYDLVVFYDESSLEVSKSPSNQEQHILLSLHKALVQFNYGKELKCPPKILKGGLDAWVDLMGPGSLQSTADPSSKSPPNTRGRNITIERRRSRYVVKQLKPDDIKQWEETIQKDDQETAASPNFVRSREDFLRRFPSISAGQQSMTAPAAAPRPRYGSSHKNDLESELPSPPSRPAPALPRQSYSSLAPSSEEDPYDGAVTISQKMSNQTAKPSPAPSEAPKFYTGLNNPHNWCYANSLLQSLLASPDFGRELADSESVGRHQVPRKADEKMDHPQLMIRIVSNLFHWMSSGKFPVMKAQTLMVRANA